jgi:DnaJ-class molecular chaperone
MKAPPASMSPDPYTILGVSRTASDADIKRAYRRLVKDLHPDQHPDDEAKLAEFKKVSSAWEILGDANKRAAYDRGEIDGEGNPRGFHRRPEGPGSGGFRGDPFAGGDPFEEILGGMFGARRKRGPGPQKGRDIRYRVEIAFEDAVTGARRRMTMVDGKALDVAIPAGIETGQTLRLKSQGQDSMMGGPPGDALLEVEVRPSTKWERDGRDLRMRVPVSLKTAVLGGSVDVETPGGPVTLKVPAGSNTGSTLRLRGKGVQVKPAGHLYARIEIVLDDPKDSDLKRFLGG